MTVKSRLLEILEKEKGETLSGEKLAEELHCTRAAIWKAVKSLREEGYMIEAGPNKGYMLVKANDRLSVEAIRPFLSFPEVYIKVYQEVDSTNRAAKAAAVNGEAGHGSFVLAGCQTEGRGRRGRSFYSPQDAGIPDREVAAEQVRQAPAGLQHSTLQTPAGRCAWRWHW